MILGLIDVAVMDPSEDNPSSDDADDDVDAAEEIPPTIKPTGKQSKASAWVVAQAHIKVTAGKKHAKAKRAAGGGKTRKTWKKVASKAWPGGEHDTSKFDGRHTLTSPVDDDVDSSTAPQHDPADPSGTSRDARKTSQQLRGTDVQINDVEKEAAKKANKILRRQTVDAMYVIIITYLRTCTQLAKKSVSVCYFRVSE